MTRPTIRVLVLGGTISMAPAAGGGIVPTLTGEDLLRAVPSLSDIAGIVVETPFLKPGASLTFAEIADLAAGIRSFEADGMVIVQGTDTIDETSFLLDLLHSGDAPIVVTGAMRGATAPGADGPANLAAAVRVAAAPQARGLGALVVLNDEIHLARSVEKTHKALPSAFASPNGGPVGWIVEDEIRLLRRPAGGRTPHFPDPAFAPVAILKVGLDDDDRMIRAVASLGYQGAVVEGMGGGHLPAQIVPAIAELAAAMPVVLATRVIGGPIFGRTYGFAGSEIDLLRRGLIPAGWLSPHKARLLLSLAIGTGATRETIADCFAQVA